MHGTFGEMPLHAMAQAAALLPLQISKKAWNPCCGIQYGKCSLLVIFFSLLALTISQKNPFSTSKNSAPQGGGGWGGQTHPPNPFKRNSVQGAFMWGPGPPFLHPNTTHC